MITRLADEGSWPSNSRQQRVWLWPLDHVPTWPSRPTPACWRTTGKCEVARAVALDAACEASVPPQTSPVAGEWCTWRSASRQPRRAQQATEHIPGEERAGQAGMSTSACSQVAWGFLLIFTYSFIFNLFWEVLDVSELVRTA